MSSPKPNFAQSIVAYFRLWRYEPIQVLGLFVLMYLGWVALGGGLDDRSAGSLIRVAWGWGAATAILLAIFLINDAADREIDRVVHPERPIPQGKSDWRHVGVLGVVLLLLAVAMSVPVNTRCVLVAVVMAALALVHYGYAKGQLNVSCSSEILTPVISALFPLLALSVAEFNDVWGTAFLLLFIYFADLAHDLLGGIHDQEGDRLQGVRTFALAIGDRATLVVSLTSFVLAAAFGLLLYLKGLLGIVYLLVLVVLTLFMLYHYYRLFRTRDESFLEAAGKVNHLGGGYFFVVSASTLLDYLVLRF